LLIREQFRRFSREVAAYGSLAVVSPQGVEWLKAERSSPSKGPFGLHGQGSRILSQAYFWKSKNLSMVMDGGTSGIPEQETSGRPLPWSAFPSGESSGMLLRMEGGMLPALLVEM
jgi:hypothetical protein